VYVVRQCGCQYYVCGDEFTVCEDCLFFCVVTCGGNQNGQHISMLVGLTSVGYGHYQRKLGAYFCGEHVADRSYLTSVGEHRPAEVS
jgi:hypothetical protein